MADQDELRGVLAAAVTPLRADGGVDVPRLLEHCRWLLSQGAHGISLFGTTGEGNSFPVRERREVLSAVAAAGLQPQQLLPAAGCCALDDTLDLLSHAVKLDCAGVLMMPPFYYKNVTEDGVFGAFAEVIEKIGSDRLRLYLYNIPQFTGVTVTEPVIARLLDSYPGVVRGLKDSSGNWAYTKSILKGFPELEIFTGTDAHLLDLLRLGGAGSISGVTNINAAGLRRLYNAWRDSEAEGLSKAAGRIAEVVESFSGIPALKHLLAHYRGDPAWARLRPPLAPLSPERAGELLLGIESQGFEPPDFRCVA